MPPQRSRPGRRPPARQGRRRPAGPVPLAVLAVAGAAIVVALLSGRIFDSPRHESAVGPGTSTSAAGGGTRSPATTSARPGTTEPAAAGTGAASRPGATAARVVRVYVMQDGELAAQPRTVQAGSGVGAAALQALLGRQDVRLAVAGGTATVTGAGPLDHAAQAEVVATLTQFPTVQRVVIDGGAPLTRSAFEDVTPPILVESPLPGERLASPLRVTGTADVFEATFMLEVLAKDGTRLAQRVVTASSGSGTRGTFDARIGFETASAQQGTLYAYEPSAEDGHPIHEVRVPLTLLP